jgi:deoxyribose-phosphate aldolase
LNGVPDVRESPLIGFPHGDSPTKDKVIAAKRAAGAIGKEVRLVVNTFKVQGSEWRHVKDEIHQVNTVVTETGGILKVMADYDCLKDRQRVELQGICSDLGVSLADMADINGLVKLPNGFYVYASATFKSQTIPCA